MPIKVNVYNDKAEAVGELKLSDKVFGVKANEALVHQAMVAQMGNERQVLAHVKDRSEVRGGGKKPWRQKGTGRARAGSNRSPIWKGGGVTFGPRSDRNFKKDINKKMKQKAVTMVLSDKVERAGMIVLEKMEVKEFKTKTVNEILNKIEKKALKTSKAETRLAVSKDVKVKKTEEKPATVKKQKRSVLVITEKKDEKAKFSFRNLVGVKFINMDNINILDLLKYRELILTAEGVKKLEKKYS